MEKKSLGRGLEDISDIFISGRKDKKTPGGFSSNKLRDATCESCVSVIRNSHKPPKCKIFTLENKKHGVRYMEALSPSSANYCEYYEPIPKENTPSDIAKEPYTGDAEIGCRIEESVTVQKNIAYPPSPNTQENILNALSKHLEENYSIKRIDLKKTDEISRPGKRKYIDEEVTIFIEDHPLDSRLR